MFTFENSLVINQPIEQVFDFLADLENLPRWNYFVTQVSKTSTGPLGVGSTYHQVRKSDSQELRIVAMEPNKTLIVETIPPSQPELRREMVFTDLDGGTHIEDKWRLDLGVPRLLEPIAARRASSGVRDNLHKLKELLETGHVTLQDGRRVSL